MGKELNVKEFWGAVDKLNPNLEKSTPSEIRKAINQVAKEAGMKVKVTITYTYPPGVMVAKAEIEL